MKKLEKFLKEVKNKIILEIIYKKFSKNEKIVNDFLEKNYEIIDLFFEEKNFWDYFFINLKEEKLILELFHNKQAELKFVIVFEKNNSVFYFSI